MESTTIAYRPPLPQLETISPYVFQRRVHQNPNTCVWEGFDRRAGRPVALKILEAGNSLSLNEAEATRRARSPWVVELYDEVVVDERVVLVLEWVDGPSARAALRDCPDGLPLYEVLLMGIELTHALTAVSAAGVVHRDIKPSNMLMGTFGTKLGDFGIARLLDCQPETIEGEGIGTFPFLAPEQIENAREAGPPSDVYGFGASLYQLLTGSPLLGRKGTPPGELSDLIATTQPQPLTVRRPSCPERIASLVHQMVAKSPLDRPELTEILRELTLGIQELQRGERLPTQVHCP